MYISFDAVVDCTDNSHSRYCINDACAHLKTPLVYGSALRWEGRLSVFCYKGGPCLRCIFPVPPDPQLVGTCDDQGIIGPVVGMIGSLQAIEAAKIALLLEDVFSGRLLLFNGLSMRIRTVSLRKKQLHCLACGGHRPFSSLAFSSSACEQQYSTEKEDCSLSASEYLNMINNLTPHVLLDVRVNSQYNSARFPHAAHIPLERLETMDFQQIVQFLSSNHSKEQLQTICVLCRRGRKSRDAVNYLVQQRKVSEIPDIVNNIHNITGGLKAWASEVDSAFPYF